MSSMHKVIFTNLIAVMVSSGAFAINVPAGQYLPANSQNPDTCPAGSFCTGGDYTFDENNSQGATPCSTLESGTYPNSEAGASTQDECYTACDLSDVAYATGVTGNDYYGNGTDTCEATSCASNYNLYGGIDAATSVGNNNGHITGSGPNHPELFSITYPNDARVYGSGICSTQSGTGMWNGATNANDITKFDTLTDNAGQYCYCHIHSFSTWYVESAYVFNNEITNDCANNCANLCENALKNTDSDSLAFRSAILSTIPRILATCTPEEIFVPEGYYLPANTTSPVICPANSYCPYDQSQSFDPNNDKNIFSCNSVENGDYPYSDEGSVSVTMCYHACNNVNDFAHATAVSGRDYYEENGFSRDTCIPTSCDDGYHPIQGGVLNANGRPEISQLAGTAFINNNNEFTETALNGDPKGQDYYGLSGKNSSAIDLTGFGLLNIRAYCNTTPGSTDNDTWENPTTFEENALTDETGTTGANYCYCRVDSYTPTDQVKQNLNTSWVFLHDYEDSQSCEDACLESCGLATLGYAAPDNSIPDNESLHLTLYAPTNLWVRPACMANTIDLTWYSNNTQYGNSTQCTYDDTIELPTPPTRTGYTFTGWTVAQ